jgi:hypothetical protein
LWYVYRKNQSNDVVKFIKYLTNATYENFDLLEAGMPEELFSSEQYMEIIINVSTDIFCHFFYIMHLFAEHTSTAERLDLLSEHKAAQSLKRVFVIWFVRLLALRSLLDYCASLG